MKMNLLSCIWGKSWICLGLDHILEYRQPPGSHRFHRSSQPGEQMISGCFLRRYGKTDSSNIGISSLEVPGRRMAVLPFSQGSDQALYRCGYQAQQRLPEPAPAYNYWRSHVCPDGSSYIPSYSAQYAYGNEDLQKRKSHYLSTYFLSQIILSWSETSERITTSDLSRAEAITAFIRS